MVAVSPRIASLLNKVTATPDPEAALWKVLSEYLDLKLEKAKRDIAAFEAKWGMSFEEFCVRSKDGRLGKDPFSYEVESDFWEWDRAETLRQQYAALKAEWT